MKESRTAGASTLGLVALTAALLIWPSAPAQASGANAAPTSPEPAVPSFARPLESWQQNGMNGAYFAPLLDGATPERTTLGIVRTDTDCAADTQGLSHCHEGIDLLDGDSITIQNNHNMAAHRCLSPGEEVTVTPIGPGWVKVHTRTRIDPI